MIYDVMPASRPGKRTVRCVRGWDSWILPWFVLFGALGFGVCPASRRGGCFGIKAGYGAPTLMKLRSVLLLLFPALLMSVTAQAKTASKHEFITLGGGCFWC